MKEQGKKKEEEKWTILCRKQWIHGRNNTETETVKTIRNSNEQHKTMCASIRCAPHCICFCLFVFCRKTLAYRMHSPPFPSSLPLLLSLFLSPFLFLTLSHSAPSPYSHLSHPAPLHSDGSFLRATLNFPHGTAEFTIQGGRGGEAGGDGKNAVTHVPVHAHAENWCKTEGKLKHPTDIHTCIEAILETWRPVYLQYITQAESIHSTAPSIQIAQAHFDGAGEFHVSNKYTHTHTHATITAVQMLIAMECRDLNILHVAFVCASTVLFVSLRSLVSTKKLLSSSLAHLL